MSHTHVPVDSCGDGSETGVKARHWGLWVLAQVFTIQCVHAEVEKENIGLDYSLFRVF